MYRVNVVDFTEYLKSLGLSEKTIINYITELNKFIGYDRFNQETIADYMAKSSHHYNISRSFLKHFRNYITINKVKFNLSHEELADIHNLVIPKYSGRNRLRIPKPLTKEQILKLEEVMPNEKSKLMLLLSFFCGLRLSELVSLRLNSFNWEQWKKNVNEFGELRLIGKANREGISLVPPKLMLRVSRFIKANKYKYRSVSDYLFIRNKKPKSEARSWQRILKQAGIDSGLTPVDIEGNPTTGDFLHPHILRHSYGYYLLNVKKLDIRFIQEALRHANINSTMIYTKVDKEDLKREFKSSFKFSQRITELIEQEEQEKIAKRKQIEEERQNQLILLAEVEGSKNEELDKKLSSSDPVEVYKALIDSESNTNGE